MKHLLARKQRYILIVLFFLPFFSAAIFFAFYCTLKTEEDPQIKEAERQARLGELLDKYYMNQNNYENPELGSYAWTSPDEAYLESMLDAPVCAIVRVTDGLEDTIRDEVWVQWYNRQYGTELKEVTEEQILQLLRDDPKLREYFKKGKIRFEAEKYIFDKTELYIPEFEIKTGGIMEVPDTYLFQAFTGMRLIAFFYIDEGTTQTYSISEGWSYYITEDQYLVPVSLRYHPNVLQYGGMELGEYKKLLTEKYKEYDKKQ